MIRYLKLYKNLISISFQNQLVYKPWWALFAFIAHGAYIGISYLFLDIASSGSLFDLTTKYRMLFLLSYFHAVKGVFWFACSVNINFLADSAFKTGELDFSLLKPINHLWWVSIQKPNIFAMTDMLGGLGLMLMSLFKLGFLSWGSVVMLVGLVPLSSLVLYGIWMCYLLWFAPYGESGFVNVVLNLLWSFGEYPSTIYSGWSTVIVWSIFPSFLIVSLPVFTVLNVSRLENLFFLAGAVLIILVLVQKFWQRAMKLYLSAS